MLKTLEEPPEYLKFVLATTEAQKVPPTVLSRCLQFNLRPMAPQTIQEYLAQVLAQEQIVSDAPALRLLARAAHGSMRDALSLADQAIAFGAGRLDESGVRQMLGAVDRGHAVRLVEALAARDGAAVVAAVDGLRGLGLSASSTLEEMAELLQQMAVLQSVPDAADETDLDAPTLVRLAGVLAPDETQLLYSIVLHGRAELGLAPDEYSGLVMVLLRMLAFAPEGSGAPSKALTPRPAEAASTEYLAAAASPASTDVPVAQELGDRWADVVGRMIAAGSITALVRELAMQAQCVAIDGEDGPTSVWRLRVDRDALRTPTQSEKLQAALAGVLGRAVRVEVEAGVAQDSPARREAELLARKQNAAEQIIHNDPLVQALMAQYKTARIVPGSVKPQ
jgi:DNA polymerase-3 subunit gamma/tau